MLTTDHVKDQLIRWIHAVEAGKPKRMAGLITELYFSRALNSSKKSGPYIEGWLYVRINAPSDIRDWFRVFLQPPVLSVAERELIQKLTPRDHRFYALEAIIGSAPIAGSADNAPTLSLRVSEWDASNNKFVFNTESAANYESKIHKDLLAYLSQVKFQSDACWDGEQPFAQWLSSCVSDELKQLFVQRCIMNGGLRHPLDLDAFTLADDGTLVFLELKRKDPAAGAKIFKPTEGIPSILANNALEIENKLRPLAKRKDEAKRLFEQECEARSLVRVSKKSFGLDMSHYNTVKLCQDNGITYRYIIWNCESERAKPPATSDEIINELENILSSDFIPKSKPTWWERNLSMSDVDGITYTFGHDSGSYNSGFRSQVTFDVFKECPNCKIHLITKTGKYGYYMLCGNCSFKPT